MKKTLSTFLLLTFFSCLAFAQIKRQYEEVKQNGRTVVVKEEGISDQQILEQRFGDVRPGKVIRITTDKPPRTKIQKPKTVRTSPPRKTQQVRNFQTKKKVKKVSKKKVKVAPPPPPPKPQKYFGVGSSRKYKTTKKRIKRKKRSSKKKQRGCYGF